MDKIISVVKNTTNKALYFINNKMSLQQRIASLLFLTTGVFIVVISTTDPDQVGPLGVFSTLVLVYTTIVCCIYYIFCKRAGFYIAANHKKILLLKSCFYALPLIIVVGLKTINQINGLDLFIIPALFLVIRLYLYRQFSF